MMRAVACLAAVAVVSSRPALAQTPVEIMPRAPTYFGEGTTPRTPDGRRLEPSREIEEALRRREAQQQGLPPPPRATPAAPPAPQRSFYSRAWLTAVERAVAHAPPARTRNEQDCITISRAAMRCRLAQDAPDGAAIDIGCVGRQIDNRDWPAERAHQQGRAYLEAYQRLCFAWLDVNQTAPLRR